LSPGEELFSRGLSLIRGQLLFYYPKKHNKKNEKDLYKQSKDLA